jgi:hypothetical protein
MSVLAEMHRRTYRAEVNPLDKSTIVSIFPFEINEKKETIQPGRFIVPPGTYDKPSFLLVEPSSWWKDVGEDQPLLEIPVSSINIADSIVRDYCNGIFMCNMGDTMPGLFYLPGVVKPEELKTTYKSSIEKAKEKQQKFWAALVKMGDVLWARTQGNPIAISDMMRMAARELGQEQKPWLGDYQEQTVIRCVACGQMRNSGFPVCPNCKAVVDKKAAEALGIIFAK